MVIYQPKKEALEGINFSGTLISNFQPLELKKKIKFLLCKPFSLFYFAMVPLANQYISLLQTRVLLIGEAPPPKPPQYSAPWISYIYRGLNPSFRCSWSLRRATHSLFSTQTLILLMNGHSTIVGPIIMTDAPFRWQELLCYKSVYHLGSQTWELIQRANSTWMRD